MEARRMSRISEDVWSRLSNEGDLGSTLWTRRAAPEITDRLFAALDSNSRRHLLVQLFPDDGEVQDHNSRGLSVITRSLLGKGKEAGRYIDIACLDPGGHDGFDLIGGEIADRVASGRERADECVVRVLSKWRRFWGQTPKNLLSRDAQIGLFAELWFFSVWLIPTRGALDSVQGWRGPFGSRHDFEWQKQSIEVKATTSTRGLTHRINGIDQLDAPEGNTLWIFSMQLREEAGAGLSLPKLVAGCRSLLETDGEAATLFDLALEQSGYSPAHEPEYETLLLRIVEEGLYEVRDDFPKLGRDSFTKGVPSGVERIDYEINLSTFQHLRIALKADQMPMW